MPGSQQEPIRELASQSEKRLLFCGPPLSGKRYAIEQAFAQGQPDAEFLVITTRSPEQVIRTRLPGNIEAATTVIEVFDTGPNGVQSPERIQFTHSPGNLAGIGSTVAKWLRRIPESVEPRVLMDSVSTLQLYRDEAAVEQFVYVLGSQVVNAGGTFLATSDDTRDCPENGIIQYFDTAFEFREGSGGKTEYREHSDGTTGIWRSLSGESVERPPEEFDSLTEAIEQMTETAQTLYAYTRDSESVNRIREAFKRTPVTITRRQPKEGAVGVIELEVWGSTIARSDIDDVVAYLHIPDDKFNAVSPPEVVQYIQERTVTLDEERRIDMLESSREIESIILHQGGGSVHVGVQTFSRFTQDERTFELYQRMAEEWGVAVHVYGVPDTSLGTESMYVHPLDEDDEAAQFWFVVYDGAGHDFAAHSLVAKESDEVEGEYSGFWTRGESVAQKLIAYLTVEYPETVS